jgi:hypothetical protein
LPPAFEWAGGPFPLPLPPAFEVAGAAPGGSPPFPTPWPPCALCSQPVWLPLFACEPPPFPFPFPPALLVAGGPFGVEPADGACAPGTPGPACPLGKLWVTGLPPWLVLGCFVVPRVPEPDRELGPCDPLRRALEAAFRCP